MAYLIQIISSFEVRVLFFLILYIGTFLLVFYAHKVERKQNLSIIIGALSAILSLIIVGKIIFELPLSPKIRSYSPGKNQLLSPAGNIKIIFTTPVYYDQLTIHTNPPFEFTIKKNGYFNNLLPIGTSLTIVPTTTLPAGEKIMVYLVNVKGPLTRGFGGEMLIENKVEGVQEIVVTKPTPTVTPTPQPAEVLLKVPLFKQETLFTCNVAATRMLLAYRGVAVSEQDLLSKIGYQAKRGSGNPHVGYVSNFGTFWEAIQKGANSYRNARLITSGNLSDILNEVRNGNPVMTWGQNGWSNPYDISWTASDGTYIKAVNGMHSVVVIGYVGPIDNPTEIWINDPWRGQYRINTSEFMRRWSFYKIAMVVE